MSPLPMYLHGVHTDDLTFTFIKHNHWTGYKLYLANTLVPRFLMSSSIKI
jgi:hypothetical protein